MAATARFSVFSLHVVSHTLRAEKLHWSARRTRACLAHLPALSLGSTRSTEDGSVVGLSEGSADSPDSPDSRLPILRFEIDVGSQACS